MTIHYNKFPERDKRKALRKNPTKAERVLWQYLKGKQLDGFKFRRQYGVDAFVIDFYCVKTKLAIEIDGEIHLSKSTRENDQHRQKYLESFGIHFLRFTNRDVFNNIEKVLQTISEKLKELDKSRQPSPSPFLTKEGE
ncbi:MAG TPA: DUF559 domain-containing protein [Caldithrix sp.]|nr:DUF559 domain-containing protein [Caldithrix sp.]